MSWDSWVALALVAFCAVYVLRRLVGKPHCGATPGCKNCADPLSGCDAKDSGAPVVPPKSLRP